MDFKTQFVLDIKKVFEKEVLTKKAYEDTKKFLDEFFYDLKRSTDEVSAVAFSNFSVNITEKSYSIKIYKSELTIYHSIDKIKVIAAPYGYGNIYTFIYNPEEYSYLDKEKVFNEKMLHHYVLETFQKPLQQLIGEEIAISVEE
jgi:hypothetical protein